MKQIFILAFVLLSLSASAQQANFESGAKKEAGVYTQFNCSITQLTDGDIISSMVTKMKATPGLLKLDVLKTTSGTADIVVVTERENDIAILQEALLAAGVKNIAVKGKKQKTTQLLKALATK